MSETTITTEQDVPDHEETSSASRKSGERKRRRALLWWFAVLVVTVAAVTAILLLVNETGHEQAALPAGEVNYGEAVVADLVQTETFDGTLGSVDGDPISTQFAGTVTAAAGAGAEVDQGDVIFSIDGAPVVLLYGEAPAYRDLSVGLDTLAVSGRLAGTITHMTEPGTALEQGDILYRVNGEPVVVLYGEVPAYRSMRDLPTNIEGDDVEQLEAALVALGYDPDGTVTVDQEFTANTADMVEAWQEDIGAEVDGSVDLGEVVFIPGPGQVRSAADVGDTTGSGAPAATIITGDPMTGDDVEQLEAALAALGFDPGAVDGTFSEETRVAVLEWQAASGMDEDAVVDLGEIVFLNGAVRVAEQLSPVGSRVNPGSPVLAVTSSDKVVRLDLPARNQGIVAVGDEVVIVMPDFSETAGIVSSVATTATVDQGNQAVFEVIIDFVDPSVAAGLDEAPVDVEVISDSVEDVLAVPVSALVALSEGGYAVEVEDGVGGTRLVAVEAGFFADGLVEIETTGVTAGDRVVLP